MSETTSVRSKRNTRVVFCDQISDPLPVVIGIYDGINVPKNIDRAYGALATYVTQHALALDGPIREYYLVGRHDTSDETAWRTEIGWPQ